MKKINANKFVTTKRKNESVEDPHELLLSLVDMGSLDADEALLACVQEMSDAECKRVLGSLSLPGCCDEVAVEDPAEDELDTALDNDEDESAEDDDFVLEDESDEDDAEDIEECDNRARELEARIRRLEKSIRYESMNRNRIRRFSHRKMNH